MKSCWEIVDDITRDTKSGIAVADYAQVFGVGVTQSILVKPINCFSRLKRLKYKVCLQIAYDTNP